MGQILPFTQRLFEANSEYFLGNKILSTNDGVISYHLETPLQASVSSSSIISYFKTHTEFLLLSNNEHGYLYFQAFLKHLTEAQVQSSWKRFSLADMPFDRIETELAHLSIFECQTFFVMLGRLLKNENFSPEFREIYNYLQSKMFLQREKLRPRG